MCIYQSQPPLIVFLAFLLLEFSLLLLFSLLLFIQDIVYIYFYCSLNSNPRVYNLYPWFTSAHYKLGLPRWHYSKESVCQCRRCQRCRFIPWSSGEGNGNLFQYSCLENSMDRGASGLQFMGWQKAGHDYVCPYIINKYFYYFWDDISLLASPWEVYTILNCHLGMNMGLHHLWKLPLV